MKNCIIVFLLIASIHTAYADDSAATLKNESEAGVVVTGGNTPSSEPVTPWPCETSTEASALMPAPAIPRK